MSPSRRDLGVLGHFDALKILSVETVLPKSWVELSLNERR